MKYRPNGKTWLAHALVFAFACPLFASDVVRYVDPFIGTSGTGHTTPAACVPFGLVQAGPDTGNGTWDYCGGYRYDDKTICGFTQTHLNGTGASDLGDVLILPVAESILKVESGKLKVAFDKTSEIAEPGYYAVTLEGGINVEIAAAEHSAIYRISGKGAMRLLVDCAYGIGGKNYAKTITASDVKLVGKSGLSGKNHRRQWVERDYSFVLKFSRECAAVEELPKREGIVASQYVFDFDAGESPLLVKVALSAEGGVEAAKRNLAAEIPGWDFDAVKGAARAKWNEVLSRATIEGADDQKKNWYTSLYHLFIQPNNISDAGAKPFYSTFSTWDTFRAAHPLYTILAPEKAAEFVDSMLEQGRRTGYLPIWTLWGKDNQCMIGTHSVPVIVDWFLKAEKNNHVEQVEHVEYWKSAYVQIKDTLTKPHNGRRKERWDLYDKYGYYPFDEIKGESVSRTMECAYDDWCAAQMAGKLGFAEDAAFFLKRSESWRNIFDPSIGLVRGKDSKGNWRDPFNPYSLGHGADTANDFTEGNAFQYTWHVMQNPQGLIEAIGGRNVFTKKLDSLFSQPDKVEGSGCVVDVTGLIGQYVHGNEPSHHVIYFYPQVGHPEKAAERIREVFDKFYLPKPDGLCGNDDCGQMSAWYLFSAMGFYPFNPCGGEYVIGAPQVPRAELKIENGECKIGERKVFTIIAKNLSKENRYVKSVTLNGKPLTDWKIRHSDIMAGGELVFEMMAEKSAVATCYTVPNEYRSELWEAEVDGEPNGVASARTADPPFDKRHDHGGEYAFTSFEMSAPVKMIVRPKEARDMGRVRLLPVSAPVAMRHLQDGALELSVSCPCKFSVEPDGRRHPLLVFANPPERNVPNESDPKVKAYGPGVHLGGDNGRIELKDGETLYLKAGAYVKGGIFAQGENIRICGHGVLDGSDWEWRKGPTQHVVQMHRCRNVAVEDITIRGASHWTIVPFNCDGVTVRNVKLCGGRVWNDDGINPCNSRDVLIEGCFLRTDDDCIAAKGLNPELGNCENVTVRNCVFWCDRARIVLLGHESGAPFMRNFLFENCDVVHFQMPVFLLEPGEEMRLDNVRARDIRINTDIPGRVYEIVSARPAVNRWMRKQVPGHVSNCSFENISVTGERADCRFSLEGLDAEHRLVNVVISNAMLYGGAVKAGDSACRIGGFSENVSVKSIDCMASDSSIETGKSL